LSANKSRQRLDAVNGGGRRWASIDYTAEYLGVHKVTVKNMIAHGRITAYRLGRRVVRIDLNEVDRSLVAYGGAVG
jgi:excisionase family DNA binding protein